MTKEGLYSACKAFSDRVFSAIMVALLSVGFAYADVSSPNESTRILSGEISENIDFDEDVTDVILNGVTMENDARIRLSAEHVPLTLTDGTSNKIAALESVGSLDVQGSGNLEGTSIFAMSGIAFNGSGQ